jgi:hypothetical protein
MKGMREVAGCGEGIPLQINPYEATSNRRQATRRFNCHCEERSNPGPIAPLFRRMLRPSKTARPTRDCFAEPVLSSVEGLAMTRLFGWRSAIQGLSFPLPVHGERDEEEGFDAPSARLPLGRWEAKPCSLLLIACCPGKGV